MKTNVFVSLLVILAIFLVAQSAEAAFVATPMEFHLQVAPGADNTQTLYVRNRGEETIALKVYTGDFWIEPDGKESFLEAGKLERSCAKWMAVSPEELELAPNQSQPIRFKITLPANASGSYWGMVFVEQTTKPSIKTAKKGQQQFSIISFQRIGIRVFEDTPNSKPAGGLINQVNVAWDTKSEAFKVSLKFENQGELLLKCKGTIEVKDDKGQTLKSTEIEQFNCYPKSSRIAEGYISTGLAKGKYTALAVIDYGAESLVAGESVFEVATLGFLSPGVGNKRQLQSVEKNAKVNSSSVVKPLEKNVSILGKIAQAFITLCQIIQHIFESLWKSIRHA